MFSNIYSYLICIIFSSSFFWIDITAIEGDNARNASACEFPYVVSIGRKNPERTAQENHICTGVLISRKAVLTAAHCFVNRTWESVQITYGTIDLLEAEKTRGVLWWITYDEWASIIGKVPKFALNDIAIMKLSHPIVEKKVTPILLSPLNTLQIERSKGMIAGFGKIDGVQVSRYLRAANVNILSNEACSNKARIYINHEKGKVVPEKTLCSHAEPYILTTCGDSGGPLLNMRRELVGINLGTCPNYSWYQEDGAEEFLKNHRFNGHASTDFYRDFINYYST